MTVALNVFSLGERDTFYSDAIAQKHFLMSLIKWVNKGRFFTLENVALEKYNYKQNILPNLENLYKSKRERKHLVLLLNKH